MPLVKVWSENELNKKFVVAENVAELVSKGITALFNNMRTLKFKS